MTLHVDKLRWLGRAALAAALLLVILTSGGCFLFPRRQPALPGGAPAGTGRVEGVLTDERGQGVAGVSVTIPQIAQYVAVTDQNGRFSFPGLAPGDYYVRATKEGYLAGSFEVTVASTSETRFEAQLLGNSGRLHNDSQNVPGLCAECHVVHDPTSASHLLRGDSPIGPCFAAGCHAVGGKGPAIDETTYQNSPHGPAWPYNSSTKQAMTWQSASERGNCHTCHEPHGISGPPKMLHFGKTEAGKLSYNDLCYACHEGVGTGNTDGWPGKTAYTDASNAHNALVDPSGKYANGDCLICHDPHGKPGDPQMLRQAGSALCRSCHTKQLFVTSGHNGDCVICHDPHDVGTSTAVKVKHPNGSKSVLGKEKYRNATLISNSYCRECHTSETPPYPTAKDPAADTTGFTNVETASVEPGRSKYPAGFDRNLHRVHVSKVQRDEALFSYEDGIRTEADHPYWPFLGDVNVIRCTQCHSLHATSDAPAYLLTNVVKSRIKTGGGYNGKAGCSVAAACHTCDWCHAAPGGPGQNCVCSNTHQFSYLGYHGVQY